MAKDPYRYFRIEAREILDGLSEGVLEMERGADAQNLVAKLLRLAHTLKGAARVVKLSAIAQHAHAIEDTLAPHRDDPSPVARAAIDALLKSIDAARVELVALDGAGIERPAQAASKPKDEPLETIRVEVEEMDLLLDGVTEATVQMRALGRDGALLERAQHLAGLLVDQLGAPRTERGAIDGVKGGQRSHALAGELRDLVARLGRSVSDHVEQTTRELMQVRDAANRLRLLPAQSIFVALERAARDAAQFLDKRIELHASGGDGRLDAHVLAGVRDALLHVVRNAVAHGIESEAERIACGKPPVGRIDVAVERRGDRVAFVCRDDGRGIDVENLRAVAARRGHLSAAASASIGTDELFKLLMKGGLTTTRVVTEVSGRGIGLDVLRETALRLKGDVVIRSDAGRGTTIEISVPVSLSAIAALVVDVGGAQVAVPLDAVKETLRLAESDISPTAHGDSIVHEGAAIPFVSLASILRRPVAPALARRQRLAVVIDAGGARGAVGVDRLLGTETVVVQRLAKELDVASVIAGASLDAEGNPRLVLDPIAVVAEAHARRSRGERIAAPEKRPVLVIDDSLTTRMLEQSILESAGYEVDLATSAEDALVKAKARRYGVFVVDVEMPGMDGFEFVARTRADPGLRDTPAILVTSRGGPEDRRRGADAGARGYVVKGEFDQELLLRTIRELVGQS